MERAYPRDRVNNLILFLPEETSLSPLTDECVSSQGITVRDPETGAIFVQTQLLQVNLNCFHSVLRITNIITSITLKLPKQIIMVCYHI